MGADGTEPAMGPYEHRGTRAVQHMVEYAPATGSLALWVHHHDDDRVPGAVLACNDGASIRYGPAFEGLSLARQAGVVAHEVLHVALRHVPRYAELQRQLGDVDPELFNICADAIVNSALSHVAWLEIDARAVRLEDLVTKVLGSETDPTVALLEWDVERLYRAVDDRGPPRREVRRSDQPKNSRQRNVKSPQRTAKSSSTFGRTDGPRARQTRMMGTDSRRDLILSSEPSRPELEAERSRDWRERVLRGHADDGVHSMLRALLADLPKVYTPWEQLLRTQLTRGLSLRPARSWSRPSRSYIANQGRTSSGRRMPWEPGWSSVKAVPRLAVMVDVSGSIEEGVLRRFSGEVAAITRRHQARTVVVIGDNRVRSVVHFDPGLTDLTKIEFQGGGGTNFSPLLEEADRWRPDIGVFLTDLKGPASYRPGFSVIWAVPRSQADREHPFGRKVVLD